MDVLIHQLITMSLLQLKIIQYIRCLGTSVTLTLMDSYGDGGGSVTIDSINYELPAGFVQGQRLTFVLICQYVIQ